MSVSFLLSLTNSISNSPLSLSLTSPLFFAAQTSFPVWSLVVITSCEIPFSEFSSEFMEKLKVRSHYSTHCCKVRSVYINSKCLVKTRKSGFFLLPQIVDKMTSNIEKCQSSRSTSGRRQMTSPSDV
jgi:hypothetical protein